MSDDNAHAKIARLEERIEELAQSAERCAKLALFAQGVLTIGGVAVAALIVGALKASPLAVVLATSALLGGIVLYGANSSTAQQVAAAREQAEALRSELIGTIALQVVE